jgi:hypothetical protein
MEEWKNGRNGGSRQKCVRTNQWLGKLQMICSCSDDLCILMNHYDQAPTASCCKEVKEARKQGNKAGSKGTKQEGSRELRKRGSAMATCKSMTRFSWPQAGDGQRSGRNLNSCTAKTATLLRFRQTSSLSVARRTLQALVNLSC